MKCSKCGSVINKKDSFCTVCGNTVDSEAMKKNKFNVKLWVILAISVLTVILIIGLVLFLINPERRIVDALKNGKYEEACTIYFTDYNKEEPGDALKDAVSDEISKVKNDFSNGKINKSEALKKLSQLGKFKIVDINDAIDFIHRLDNSFYYFDEGMTEYKNGNYRSAIFNLSFVIKEDKNYNEAQTTIKLSQEKCIEYDFNLVDEYVESGNYRQAYDILNELIIEFPEYENDINSKIDEVETKVADAEKDEVLKSAQEAANLGNYIEAYQIIDYAYESNPDDEDYKELHSEYYSKVVEDAIDDAESYGETEDYIAAYKVINTAVSVVGDNKELAEQESLYVELYTSKINDTVNSLLDKGDAVSILEAQKVVSEALNQFPEDELLNSLNDKVYKNGYSNRERRGIRTVKGRLYRPLSE